MMNLKEDLDRIEQHWSHVESHLNDASTIEQHDDGISKWGVGQQLLHLLRVEKMILGGVLQLIANPTAGPPNETSDFKREVLANGIPRGVGDSPPQLRVDTPPGIEEIREELKGARENWTRVLECADQIEGVEGTFPHHRLGPMNSAEWVRFIALHNDLHLGIIDDILKAKAA